MAQPLHLLRPNRARTARHSKKLSLTALVILSLVCQVLITVRLIEYLSVQSSRQIVQDLVLQLMGTTGENICQTLDNFSADRPVYDPQGQLPETVSSDLPLSSIGHFLQTIDLSPSSSIFIVERSGALIATSTHTPNAHIPNAHIQDEQPIRFKAIDSQDKAVRLAAQALAIERPDWYQISDVEVFELTIDRRLHFVRTIPWTNGFDLDWQIVMVVPENDFMGQLTSTARHTVGWCGLTLTTSALIGILMRRWIIRPIKQLNQSVQALAQVKGTPSVIAERHDEVGQLALSFKEMLSQLQTSSMLLEQQVQEKTFERTKGKTLANQAHTPKSDLWPKMGEKLRTPVNGILGYAQILLRDGMITPQQQNSLSVIQQRGNHLLTLINDILDILKIEAHTLELSPTPFAFPAFLQSIQAWSQIRAEARGLPLIVDFDPNLPMGVSADKDRLGQVLMNLLVHAITFPKTEKITFRVFSPPQATDVMGDDVIGDAETHRIRFEINHLGIGLSPEEMEKIFLPFEPVGGQLQENVRTGLELTISQKIVALMGGQLNVSSSLNQGSTFWFDLPLAIALNFPQVSVNPEGAIAGDKEIAQDKPQDTARTRPKPQSLSLAPSLVYHPPEMLTSLPLGMLRHLSDLIEWGDTDAIIEQAEIIKNSHPTAQNFAQQLKQLAKAYRMDELAILVQTNLTAQGH